MGDPHAAMCLFHFIPNMIRSFKMSRSRHNFSLYPSLVVSAVTWVMFHTHLDAQTSIEPSAELTLSRAKGYDYLADLSKIYNDEKPGLMIITTEDLKAKVKNFPDFVHVKHHVRDFRVFMATEKVWAGKSQMAKDAAGRKADPGRVAGLDILDYLRNNYERLGLKFVLFVGDARPEGGTTPMLRIRHHKWHKNFINWSPDKKNEIDTSVFNAEQKRNYDYSLPNGRFVDWGDVISDYPYADLDTDWNGSNDGFLDAANDKNPEHTRETEVAVGRIPYYGEESKYGKIVDVEAILARSIRYDTEENINYRYSVGVKHSPDPYYEKMGINYHLVDRHKTPVRYGLPALRGSNGEKHISNFEQIQNYSTATLNTYSHGGAFGMEGLHSNFVRNAHDRYPTYSSLGACDIGNIQQPENLCYTLLRFQGIGVSGGTGSVTNYGGDFGHAERVKRGKGDYLHAGKSIGEAHWGWYGALYHQSDVIPMTGAKINLYGDPTLVPFRNGPKPPYPFIARPVAGYFSVATTQKKLAAIVHKIRLENNQKKPTTVKVETSHDWLKANVASVTLNPGQSRTVTVAPTVSLTQLDDGYNEASIILTSDDGYSCTRRFVIKKPQRDLIALYSFNEQIGNQQNLAESGSDHEVSLTVHETPHALADGVQTSGALVKGYKDGTALDMRYPANGGMRTFESENFAVALYLMLDSEKKLKDQSGKNDILWAKDFFNLRKEGEEIVLQVRDMEGESVEIRQEVDLKENKWTHLAFSIDQIRAEVRLFVNGRSVGVAKVKPNRIYMANGWGTGAMDAFLDELIIYGDALDRTKIVGLGRGKYVTKVSPKDGFSGVNPRGFKFDFHTGVPAEELHVVYQRKGQSSSRRIVTANEEGEFVAPSLSDGSHYQWFVTTKDKSLKTKVREFATAKELLRNGYLEDKDKYWTGDIDYLVHKNGDKRIVVKPGGAFSEAGRVEPNKVYVLDATLWTRRKGNSTYGLYYTNSKGERVELAKQRLHYHKTDGRVSLEYVSPPSGDVVGRKLEVGFGVEEGTSDAHLFDVSLLVSDAGDRDLPPSLLMPESERVFTVKVGQVGFSQLLSEIAVDPEGKPLGFELLQGPEWVYIQSDESIFSNFGPPASDLGEHTLKIRAKDRAGQFKNFEVILKVVE